MELIPAGVVGSAPSLPIGEPISSYSKNISYKMLKDVGMTVPKSRETSEVYSYMQQHRGWGQYNYMQQDRGWEQYICSKTRDEGMQQ